MLRSLVGSEMCIRDRCGADGSNIVRNDDGVHMCPGTAALPCPVYSSGAYRFATAIVNAVRAL